MGGVRLTGEQRREARRLRGRGWPFREIAVAVGCSHESVRRVARDVVGVEEWLPGPGRLTLEDREEISRGLLGGETFSVIAARLGRVVSTVSREVAGNGGREEYRAWRAHGDDMRSTGRPGSSSH